MIIDARKSERFIFLKKSNAHVSNNSLNNKQWLNSLAFDKIFMFVVFITMFQSIKFPVF